MDSQGGFSNGFTGTQSETNIIHGKLEDTEKTYSLSFSPGATANEIHPLNCLINVGDIYYIPIKEDEYGNDIRTHEPFYEVTNGKSWVRKSYSYTGSFVKRHLKVGESMSGIFAKADERYASICNILKFEYTTISYSLTRIS